MKTIRETSDFVIDKMAEKLVLTDDISLLEPSAGEGKIIDYINKHYTLNNLTIATVELNKEKYEVLKEKGYNPTHGDFLTFSPDILFDRIIACPPFKKGVDVVHIQRMYVFLKRRGVMVTLTSPYWMTNNEPEQIGFRKWLKDKNYEFQLLPDDSFKEKGKNVPTGILKIIK